MVNLKLNYAVQEGARNVRVAPKTGISTSLVVIILVVVLAAAAAGVYYATRPSSSTASTSSVSSSSTSTVQQTTTTGSMSSSSSTGTAKTPSTTTTTSLTCGGTTVQTTNTEGGQLAADFDAINEFRAVSYSLNLTSQSTTSYETFSYLVTPPSTGGLSAANFTDTVARNSTSEVTSDLAWVNVGSMSVVNITQYVKSNGHTYNLGTQTGVEAETTFAPLMSEFTIYNTEYGVEYYSYFTNSQYFHSTGTTPMTFGSTTFDVATYVANSTPEAFNACGSMFTLDQWTLQLGTPPGTSTIFVTYIHSVGSDVVNGVSESNNFTLALTSLTVA